jgi:hypothetical protein
MNATTSGHHRQRPPGVAPFPPMFKTPLAAIEALPGVSIFFPQSRKEHKEKWTYFVDLVVLVDISIFLKRIILKVW